MGQNCQRILILDDDVENAELLRAILGVANFTSVTLNPCNDYLNKIIKEGPDLILINANLTGWDAHEICQSLKDEPLTQNIPVVFVNGRDIREEIEFGIASGADEYLSNAVGPQMLLKTIKTILEFDAARRQQETRETG